MLSRIKMRNKLVEKKDVYERTATHCRDTTRIPVGDVASKGCSTIKHCECKEVWNCLLPDQFNQNN